MSEESGTSFGKVVLLVVLAVALALIGVFSVYTCIGVGGEVAHEMVGEG